MFGSPLRKAVSFGLFASTAALAVALTLGFFSAWHPAFDSFAHFRVHLGALLVMTAPLLFFAAYRLHAAAALLLGLGAISTTLPAGSLPELGSVQAALPPEANQPVYKLLQLNLRYNNAEPEKVLSFIGRVRPDVVTLDEVSTMWEGKLALLKAAYPYQINCRVRRFGVALRRAGHSPRARSHVALTAARLRSHKSISAASRSMSRQFTWHGPGRSNRNGNSAIWRSRSAASARPAILAGDFNATPWSHTAAKVAGMGGLTPFAGIGPTWLAFALPRALRWAGLPIDQVMAKGDLEVWSATILDTVGSDHRPVLVEFSLRPGRQRTASHGNGSCDPVRVAQGRSLIVISP